MAQEYRFIPEGQELTYKPDGSVALTGSPTISVPQGTAENVTNQAPARASNPGTAAAGIAFNQGSLGTRPNAQTPTVAQNFVGTTNTNVVNSITNGAALTTTGTIPAPASPATNIVAAATPSALNGDSTIGPATYPRAPTGSGVIPIKTTESAPQPLNTNPFATAGRTQTIVRES